MQLTYCEANFDLNWSENGVVCEEDKTTAFAMSSTKFYIQVVTLSTSSNVKLLQQWKPRVKRTINWKKRQKINRSPKSILRYIN